jgi:hypothetical protein
MRPKNHLRILTGLLVVFFLFATTAARLLASQGEEAAPSQLLIAKTVVPLKANVPLPFEEKEEEKEQEKSGNLQADSFLHHSTATQNLLRVRACRVVSHGHRSLRFDNSTPLFLAKRSLLI